MQEILKEYGPVIIVALVFIILIAVVNGAGDIVKKYFEEILQIFQKKVTDSVGGAGAPAGIFLPGMFRF